MQRPRTLKLIRRPLRRPFLILGLTGSIAMGKSTAAKLLTTLGVPVFDADAVVHGLMKLGSAATAEVEIRFPGLTGPNGVDRQKLGSIVFADSRALEDLERIVHPRTRLARERFLRQAALQRKGVVALDIPLLFESKGERLCDAAAVVSAPAFLQRQRALARPGMTKERLHGILARQLSDAKKRTRADAVIPSGLGKREALRRLLKFLKVWKRRRQLARPTIGNAI